jgi:Mlc titration factor MtfA (ptsG expression regulator)
MRFSTPRGRRRRALAEPFPDAWRTVLERRWALWPLLSDTDRSRLETLVKAFVYDRPWEAAQGFALTDEVRVLVAAQACLLVLGMDLEPEVDVFSRVQSIIVHRSTVVLKGQRAVGASGGGLMADGPMPVAGQAHHRGPVLLSWSTLAYEARHPERGQNVVMHEFAHQLDMLDGVIDGTPPIPEPDRRDRFVDVCTDVFERLQHDTDPVVREYAATDPGEFFAVVTETFFTKPVALLDAHPALYDVFADFYGQDPAARATRQR